MAASRPADTPKITKCGWSTTRQNSNPDEWAWKNVKHDTIGRQAILGADNFAMKVLAALERLAQLPHIVRAFFADPNLCYITP